MLPEHHVNTGGIMTTQHPHAPQQQYPGWPTPTGPAPAPKRSRIKGLLTHAAVGIVCLALGAAVGGSETDTGTEANEETQHQPDDTQGNAPADNNEGGDQEEQEEPAADEQSATDLAAGDTYTWDNGLTISVDSAIEVTDLGEFDFVEEEETPFRVTLTLTNNGDQPIDLDEVSVLASGATNGGDASFAYIENGANEVTGRLAPGVTEEKNADWSLAPDYGRDVLVTVDYWGENGGEFFDESPEWLLTIG